MQVYIYICWQLELSGNANLRLYQCWFAFTHRSPIKNFCRLSFTRKNFASLRLRKNLVELRTRLSLLVDKTTFQHSALTIYYTTIDRNAPATSTRSHGGRGRPGRAGPSPPPRPPWVEEVATDAPDHHPPAPAAVGRKNRRVYARLFYLLVKNQCIIFCHLMPLKFLLGTKIYFYHFCSRHRIRAMFRI